MSVKAKAVSFLEALGFSDVRPVHGDAVRLVVRDAVKAVRKCLKNKRGAQFSLVEQNTTPNSTVQKYFVIEDRKIVGHMHVQSFVTHSVVELINISEAQ